MDYLYVSLVAFALHAYQSIAEQQSIRQSQTNSVEDEAKLATESISFKQSSKHTPKK
jgi:hypothetical protein